MRFSCGWNAWSFLQGGVLARYEVGVCGVDINERVAISEISRGPCT